MPLFHQILYLIFNAVLVYFFFLRSARLGGFPKLQNENSCSSQFCLVCCFSIAHTIARELVDQSSGSVFTFLFPV